MHFWDILRCSVLGQHDSLPEHDALGPYLRCVTCRRRTQGWSHQPWPQPRDRWKSGFLVVTAVCGINAYLNRIYRQVKFGRRRSTLPNQSKSRATSE